MVIIIIISSKRRVTSHYIENEEDTQPCAGMYTMMCVSVCVCVCVCVYACVHKYSVATPRACSEHRCFVFSHTHSIKGKAHRELK